MAHPFMTLVAEGLCARAIATCRFNFPYMERGSKRPDPPRVAQAAVHAAVEHVRALLPGVPLVAGGKSFGGRMTSQAQAQSPLPDVRGIAFLGFPLHAAGKPGVERAEHLLAIDLPLLFVQGTRDSLAEQERIRAVVQRLGHRATLHFVDQGDHSFRVPARSGRRQQDAYAELLDTLADWIDNVVGLPPRVER